MPAQGFQEQVDKLDASLKEVMEECKQKATAQQLQMMQRDLVVELWSMYGLNITSHPMFVLVMSPDSCVIVSLLRVCCIFYYYWFSV